MSKVEAWVTNKCDAPGCGAIFGYDPDEYAYGFLHPDWLVSRVDCFDPETRAPMKRMHWCPVHQAEGLADRKKYEGR